MALQEIVEQTVSGLGYDLVEVERSAGGLLRVTIDLPWVAPSAVSGGVSGAAPQAAPSSLQTEQFINVEDCEKVNRQLQFALEVDGIEYTRLEVSSPGIDRPLRHELDFVRFTGHVIDVTLKVPMGEAANGQVRANRKKFRGTLERVTGVTGKITASAETDASAIKDVAIGRTSSGSGGLLGASTWQIVWSDEPPIKPGQRVSKKRVPAPLQALGFRLDELREARLAPLVSFKGRGTGAGAGAGVDVGQATQD